MCQDDLILDDFTERKAFLEESAELLGDGHLQSALDLARKRIAVIPGDVDAGIVMVQALIGLGLGDDALQLLAEIKRNIKRWTYVLETLESSKCRFPSPTAALAEETVSTGDQNDPVILEAFYTPTMAELFLHQGHIDMAKEIYAALLKKNPTDSDLQKKMKDFEMMPQGKPPVADVEKRLAVINELEKWITKIRKSA